MNLTFVHYIQLGLGAVVVGAQYVATSLPQYASVAHGVSTLAASLLSTLSVLSPSAQSVAAAPKAA